MGVPVHQAVAGRRLGQAVVHVERHDLTGVVQRQRVRPVAGPVGHVPDEAVDLAAWRTYGSLSATLRYHWIYWNMLAVEGRMTRRWRRSSASRPGAVPAT